ncbi:MAG: hypothetical protein E7G41_07895 [Bifidobacterium sp.]|nr:hypothetical protein [Bifidobacterium sp.]
MKVNWEAKATKVVALGSLEPGELVRHTAGHIEGAYIVTDQGAEGRTEVVRLNDGAWVSWPDTEQVAVLDAETTVHGVQYE